MSRKYFSSSQKYGTYAFVDKRSEQYSYCEMFDNLEPDAYAKVANASEQ